MALGDKNIRGSVSKYINSSYLAKWGIVGILIGTVSGLGATAFYYLLNFATNNILGRITGFYAPSPAGEIPAPATINPHYFLIPLSIMLGGLVVGLITYKFAPEAEGHGTDAAIDAFHNKNGYVRKRVPFIKMITSAITIGSGGSAGREGPTAQISAGFGSFIGSFLGLSIKDRRTAVAVGIGAGIGAIFKSPFGGAILSAEILYSGGDMEFETIVPGFIASPIGYVIFASFTNFSPIFGSGITYNFLHPFNLILYAILGVAAGLTGKLYSFSFYRVRTLFDKLRVKKYFRPMIGGGIAGIIAIFFPQVTGLGYGYVQYLLDGKLSLIRSEYVVLPLLATLIILVFAKIIATSFTVGSGGSGGVFAPSLVIGAFLGAFMWVIIDMVNKTIIPTPAPFVIVGMMATFAGAGRVPIAVILMVSEMTGTLTLMIPSMVAVIIAYYIVGPKYSIYKNQVRDRAESPAHRGEYNVHNLEKVSVKEIMNPYPIVVQASLSVAEVAEIMNTSKIKGIPVLDGWRLVGVVVKSDIDSVKPEERGTVLVKNVMTKNVVIGRPDDSLLDVLRMMSVNRVGRIPIVSKETSKVIGIVTRNDIYKAIQKYETSHDSLDADIY